ncbi:hypothetical protein ACF073_00170 [Streptomyces sp. NPDC015171]|uniref:hypothetical protein n=1 Tax=Streptomyces sp. NPDC015171 TaxID=3364945 RepID=UPI0036FDD4F6
MAAPPPGLPSVAQSALLVAQSALLVARSALLACYCLGGLLLTAVTPPAAPR